MRQAWLYVRAGMAMAAASAMAYGAYAGLRDRGRLGPALVLSASIAGLLEVGS